MCLDLYGQVVADNIDGKQISGVGGHEDFVAGADLTSTRTPSSASIRRLPAKRTFAHLPLAPRGAVISTPRHHTGVVVTEYGVAELTGLTVRERARALADISHPDFRSELHVAAENLGRK